MRRTRKILVSGDGCIPRLSVNLHHGFAAVTDSMDRQGVIDRKKEGSDILLFVVETSIHTYHYLSRNRKRLSCSLQEDTIQFSVQARNQLVHVHTFRYTEIERIHLSVPDLSWHSIDIFFRDNSRIHLKSVTFFIERDGKLIRPKTNVADLAVIRKNQADYCRFVLELHKRIGLLGNTTSIKLTHGDPWRKTLIAVVLVALVIGFPILWEMGSLRRSFFFGSAFLLLLLYSRRINFRKSYAANHIPPKYLP